ncbi:MAG: metallophosphoesterase [Verrucomicrobiia bacterium]
MKQNATLHRLSLNLLAFCALATASFGAEPDGKEFSIIAGPVRQSPTETTMRITWVTDKNATGEVEFGPVGGELTRAFHSRDGLIAANERVHSVVLEGLQPGAAYRYRAVSREIVKFEAYKVEFGATAASDFREFRTLDSRKAEFSFLVLNDIHDQASSIPELLGVAGADPYDFVIMNGDIVSHTDDEKPVLSILNQAAASYASHIPMFWVRGNHETRGSFARHLPSYIGLPEGRYYYSFTHGPVHFLVLDAGEDKIDASPEYSGLVDFSRYRRKQAEWLKTAVRREEFQRARYRVLICHMPFASKRAAEGMRPSENTVFLGMAETFGLFGSTLESAGVDLMISGHTHSAAIIPPESARHSYPIVQGGGNKGQARTVIRVKVNAQSLDASILRPDGSLFATCRVNSRVR